MKHEITSQAVVSMADKKHVVVNKADIITDTGFNMSIELVDGKMGHVPADRIDAERCTHYGVWTATFWRNNVPEPVLRLTLGTTPLTETPDLGLELFAAEGATEQDSLRTLLSITAEKLLMALPYSALGHYVVEEYVELAQWLFENNLVTPSKQEVRTTRVLDGCKLERLWSIRKGVKPELKQTLVSFDQTRVVRQTMLIEKSHHVLVKVSELGQITARYMDSNAQAESLRQQSQVASGGIPYGHPVMQLLQYMQINGFDQKLINAVHEEALKKPHLFQQGMQTYGSPVPMGYPMPVGVAPEIMQAFMSNAGNHSAYFRFK